MSPDPSLLLYTSRSLVRRPRTGPMSTLRVIDRLPRRLLRTEGLAVAIASIALYYHADYTWWLFAVLVLAPDVSILG